MKNAEAPDLSIVYTSLIFRHKNASISNPIPIEKLRSKTVPLRGAATNLRAIHLSIVQLLDILLRSDEKFGRSRSQHCICFSNYWRQLGGQQISRRYTVLSFFHQKNLPKKTSQIKEVYTAAHTRTQQEWVPEGTKSQICIRITYFLHAFRAMTPRPPCATRFRLQDWQALM